MSAAPIMISTTPVQRSEETCSCKNHIAANVANTKLRPVSGHRKLMSLRDISTSRQTKNSASKNTPSRIWALTSPASNHAGYFMEVRGFELRNLGHSFLEQHHAGALEDQADKEN